MRWPQTRRILTCFIVIGLVLSAAGRICHLAYKYAPRPEMPEKDLLWAQFHLGWLDPIGWLVLFPALFVYLLLRPGSAPLPEKSEVPLLR